MVQKLLRLPSAIKYSELKIGSLVCDTKRPHENAYAPDELDPFQDPLRVKVDCQKDGSSTIDSKSEQTFFASLVALISFNRFHPKTSTFTVKYDKKQIYELEKPAKWFKVLCEQEETKEWLEDGSNETGLNIYLVTGMETYTGAKVEDTIEESRDISGGVAVPLHTKPADDISIRTEHKSSNKTHNSYSLEGEYIFFVQYQKVNFVSAKKLANATLDKAVIWERVTGTRAQREEEATFGCELAGEDEDGEDEYELLTGSKEDGVDYLVPLNV